MKKTFSDFFAADRDLIRAISMRRPYASYDRDASQTVFARMVGCPIGYKERHEEEDSEGEGGDRETEDQESVDYGEYDDKELETRSTAGRAIMAKQLNDALVRVIDGVSKRLAIRFEVDGLKKSLKQARTSIHNLPKRDKTGTPDKEKTAFPYLFLDLRNRSRINKFARAKMDDILKSAVRPERAKVVDSELDQWISEATGQSVTLIDDEDTPSPLPRKSGSSGNSVATPKGGSLGRRRRRPVDETPTRGGRPEVTATGTGK